MLSTCRSGEDLAPDRRTPPGSGGSPDLLHVFPHPRPKEGYSKGSPKKTYRRQLKQRKGHQSYHCTPLKRTE